MKSVDTWIVVVFGLVLQVNWCIGGARNSRSSGCLVIAPHEFHIDEEESVFITVPITPHSPVQVELTFHDGNWRFGRQQATIDSSVVSQKIRVTLRERDLPRRNGSPRIHLVTKCNGAEVVRTRIKISYNKPTVLVQTDKPIYTPEQKVLIRVFTLDRSLLPSDFPFYVDIKNPQGVIVQRDKNPPDELDDDGKIKIQGMFHTQFQFPPFPMFGEWQVVIDYGRRYGLREKSTFVVKEYELPQFSVELKVDADVIFPLTQDVGLQIKARYVFGGPVIGSAFCKFGIVNPNREIMFRSIFLKDFGGEKECIIEMTWVKSMSWFPKIEGSRLLIECNVTDSTSMKIVTAVNKKSIFSKSPCAVNFEKSQGYFKPNLPYFLQADVKHINGGIFLGERDAHVTVADERGRDIPGTNKPFTADDSGRITVNLDMKAVPGGRIVKVTIARDWVFEHKLERDDSSGDRFISVTPSTSRMPLREGQTVQFEVRASHPREINTLHYAIISKETFKPSKTKYRPGEEMTITLNGPPHTYFALLAVDQAVYMLRNKSRLTSNKMLRVINRDVVKQSELGSSREAMDQTNVKVFGGSAPHIQRRIRSGLVLQRSRGRIQRGARRRVAREAESGDAEIGNETLTGMSDDYYYADNNYQSYEDEIYESGEDRDNEESKIMETEVVEEMTLEECCDRAPLDIGDDKCKEAAMNLTELVVSSECIHTFYNCCLRQQDEREDDDGQEGWSDDRILVGMSHLHPRRHPIFKRKKGYRTTPKMKNKNFRLFKSAPSRMSEEDKDIFEVSSAGKTGVFRQSFPESWMFDAYPIGPSSGTKKITYRVPDSITKWDLQAVIMHQYTGLCVLTPKEIQVSKEIFMIVDMPYEAVRREQLEVKVTIHNNCGQRITADLYVVGVDGICTGTIPGGRSKKITVDVYHGSQQHASWAILPSKVGQHNLRFELHARPYYNNSAAMKLVDSVLKPLRAVPEGIERIRTVRSFILDPQQVVSASSSIKNEIQRELVKLKSPDDAIPGSVEVVINLNGDLMGRAVDTVSGDLKWWLKQPIASGEETMMTLGPVLYTAKYLKKTDQLSVKQRRLARKRIKMGVQRMLTFRKPDGSFAIWSQANSSTWLTAFVMKVFAESQEFGALSGDPSKILCSASRWLANQQENDGSFREISPFSTRQIMMKNDIEGTVALTAFTVVALKNVDCNQRGVIQKALDYLQGKLSELQYKPYPLSLATYAFSVSKHPSQDQSGELLWNGRIMRCADNAKCYWPTDRSHFNIVKPDWYKSPKALEIETAAYALLSYLEQKKYVRANKIAQWLVEQKTDNGAFVSTQDTMLALKSLSLFSSKMRRQNIDLQIVLSAGSFRKNINIGTDDALTQHQVKLTNHVGGDMNVTSRGRGVGQAHIHMKYHSRYDDNDSSCKFDLNVRTEEKKKKSWEDIMGRRRRSMGRKFSRSRPRRVVPSVYGIELTVCLRYLDKQPTGLAMLEVGLFTGFEPFDEQLQALKRNANNHIGRYKVHNRGIHFVFDHISNQRQTCLTFDVRQKQKVGNTQAVAVIVFDLNEPSARCTKFYHPNQESELRGLVCERDGECTCRN